MKSRTQRRFPLGDLPEDGEDFPEPFKPYDKTSPAEPEPVAAVVPFKPDVASVTVPECPARDRKFKRIYESLRSPEPGEKFKNIWYENIPVNGGPKVRMLDNGKTLFAFFGRVYVGEGDYAHLLFNESQYF